MGIIGLDILGDFGLAKGSGGGSRLLAGILASHTEQCESEQELTLDDRISSADEFLMRLRPCFLVPLRFGGGEGILRLRPNIGDLRLLLKDLDRLTREPLAIGDSEEDLRLLLECKVKGDFLARYGDRRLLNGDARRSDIDLRDLLISGDRESGLRRLRDEDLRIDAREQLEEKLLDERLLIDLDLLSVYNSLNPECFHLLGSFSSASKTLLIQY